MNKGFHRVIFNKARGMRMAVQETASSAGKAAVKATTGRGHGEGAAGDAAAALRHSWIALACLLICSPALQAQIVASPNAPGNQRPTVLVAPNGVPTVNIQTPSAAGVSRNTYQDFNIGSQGAILNNSRTNVQSQLGGWIEGNQWLAKGSANVILNEVHSTRQSQLLGPLEVAGQRAQVVIANPSGIVVDGLTFINAASTTLTTGRPQWNATGGISGYQVREGSIRVQGHGMDATQGGYASILARALEVNAGIWANDLRIATGANNISADGSSLERQEAAAGEKPRLALDVAHLGGMYAGKIFIVGTEAGLGVHNAGDVVSSSSLTLSADGELRNQGTLRAAHSVDLNTQSLVNGGTIAATHASGVMAVSAERHIANAIDGSGGTIEAAQLLIDSGGDIDNRAGVVRHTASTQLALHAHGLSNTSKGFIGAEPLTSSGPAESGHATPPSPGQTGQEGTGTGNPSPGESSGGANAGSSTAIGNSRISARGSLRNDGGQIHSGGAVALQAADVNNSGGTLALQSLDLAQGMLHNVDGNLHVRDLLHAGVAEVDNTRGTVHAGQINMVVTGDVLNHGGVIAAQGTAQWAAKADLHVGGFIDNIQGEISSVEALVLSANGDADNRSGMLAANSDVRVAAGNFFNDSGDVQSARGAVELHIAQALDNGSGSLLAATQLSASASSMTNSGSMRAHDDVHLQASDALHNAAGAITAGHDVQIQAGTLHSSGVLGAGVQADGSLGATGNLRVNAAGILAAQGHNLAAERMELHGAGIDLSASQTQAQDIHLIASTSDVVTDGAIVSADKGLLIDASQSAQQALQNRGGVLSADVLDLQVANVSNTQGGQIVQTGLNDLRIGLTHPGGALDNSGGRIATNAANLAIDAHQLINHGGSVEHAAANGVLSIVAQDYWGADGQVLANGELQFSASGTLNNDGGRISADQVTLQSANLSNRAGHVVQSGVGGMHVAASRQIDNSEGVIAGHAELMRVSAGTSLVNAEGRIEHSSDSDGASLQMQAETLRNAEGDIASNASLKIQAAAQLDNAHGAIVARQVDLSAGGIDNSQGTITQFGAQATRIHATSGDVINTEGAIATNAASLVIDAAGTIHNEDGSIQQASDDGASEALLSAHAYQGQGGSIVVDGLLDVRAADSLNNVSGQLQAQSLNVQVHTLDNEGGKILQTGTSSVAVLHADGGLNNQAGTLASHGALVADAQNINNRDGTIYTAQGHDLTISAGAELDNRQGGVLASGANSSIIAGDLLNDSGSISAVGQLNAHVTGSLMNQSGKLVAQENVLLRAESIDNTRGVIASTQSTLHAQVSGLVTNTAGTLQAAQDMSLASSGIHNAEGRIIGGSIAVNTGGLGLVDNALGTIAATGAGADLTLSSGALRNDAGLIQSQGRLNIDTHGQLLSNTQSGQHGTQAGGMVAGGAMQLSAGQLDNTAGFVGAGVDLRLDLAGLEPVALLNQEGGQIISQADLSIHSMGAGIDNRGGELQALGSLTVDAAGATMDNTGGLIRSASEVSLSAQTIKNTQTNEVADAGIEGTDIVLKAERIDNRQGSIVADRHLGIDAASHLDNAQGLLSAGGALSVNASLSGAASDLVLGNQDGRVVGGQSVELHVAELAGQGQLLSGGDMRLTTQQDLINTSRVEANGNLEWRTSGNIVNEGVLNAAGDLHISGKDILNAETGEMTSGSLTEVSASGQLTNRGLVDGAQTRINATTLDNAGAGRIYGDHLSIAAHQLHNHGEDGKAGTIAARSQLDIGAGQLINEHGALIFSDGRLNIGGQLDVNGLAVGSADLLHNAAATIESSGNMAIAAQRLENVNVGLSVREVTTSEAVDQTYVYMNWNLSGERYEESELGHCWKCGDGRDYGYESWQRLEHVAPSTDYPFEAGYQRYPYLMPGEFITPYMPPGGDTEAIGDLPPRKEYAETDLVWTLFDVPYGDTALLTQRLTSYNTDLMSRSTRAHTVVHVSDRQTTQTVVDNHGVAGKISSGANVSLQLGSGINNNSQLLAGGTLTAVGGSLENIETQGSKTVVESGTWRKDDIEYSPYRIRHGNGGTGLYSQTLESETIRISTGLIQENASTTPSISIAAPTGGASAIVDSAVTGELVTKPAQASVETEAIELASGSTTSAAKTQAAQGAEVSAAAAAHLAAESGAQAASTTQSSTAAHGIVRTSLPEATLPTASLFGLAPGSSSSYLVETDPRFTNYRDWLVSDYMLQALGVDPAATLKRLGDGYYEQKLIREQVAHLTGRRFLDGYVSDEEQYLALMNAGITFAQQFGIAPGVALSAEQMAHLTTDMVWLVAQTVTLPDGSTQTVLAPQVYVRLQPGDIDGSGALLAGQSINLQLTGDLTNAGGTMAGRNVASITADNINNLNGRITGNALSLDAIQDINNIGGTVDARDALIAKAGGDILSETTTRTSVNDTGLSSFGRTGIDRVAGLYVTGEAEGILMASAGRDINLVGSIISNASEGGVTQLIAGQDVNLKTVMVASSESLYSSAQNYADTARSQEVGSQIATHGDAVILAGRDINARASTIDAEGDLALQAERDVHITAGTATTHLDELHTKKKKGFLSSSQSVSANQVDTTGAIASTLGGNTVRIQAGQDISVTGSQVVSDAGTVLRAGSNVNIVAAEETVDESHYRHSSQSGLFGGGGVGFTIGSQKQTSEQMQRSTTAAASTVGSIDGDVTIVAGDRYSQVGSDVVAPQGDVSVQTEDIAITEARETSGSSNETRFKQSGVSVSIGSPVISAVQTADNMAKAASNTSSGRMQALAATATALNVHNSAGDLKGVAQGLANGDISQGISISVSLGSSKSQSTSTQSSDSARGSSVVAGGNVNLVAQGGGQNSDILVRGSDISAGKDAALKAEGDIRLQAAQNQASQGGSNSSSSGSIGISLGAQTGITASASKGRGNEAGDDLMHSNTHITAGNTVKLQSGADTTLQGAVVKGNSVKAEVDGNLRIESLQDNSTYASRNESIGSSLTISPAGVPTGGGFNVSQSKLNSDYQNVTEQSGIKAGDGGFDVQVKGDTELKGAVIASNQAAVEQDKNRFSTGGELTTSDLHNSASYEGQAVGVNASVGDDNGKFGVKGVGAGVGKDSGNADSTTTAGISGMAGDTAVRSTDAEAGIQRIFDKEMVQKEIDAQVAITAEIGMQASKAWGEYANGQFVKAVEAVDAESARCWGPDGACRAGGHALVGGLGGGVAGMAGAGLSSVMAPQVQQALVDSGIAPSAAQSITQLVVIGSGGIVGGVSGAAGATNEVNNNFIFMAPAIAEGVVLGGSLAVMACLSSPACVKALQRAGDALIAKMTSLLTPDELATIPGFGSGDKPQLNKPLTNPIPDPVEIKHKYGLPPFQDTEELRFWLDGVLAGYPADEAEKWAHDLIRTLPMSDQQHYSDLIIQQVHHICTNKNCVSTYNGGPWTPEFQKFFERAGVPMDDEANKVWVAGHKGPHPQEYHEAVYQRLRNLDYLSGDDYKDAFKEELRKIGVEIQTPGTRLNNLITKK